MNENLNLVEILKDCPIGTKLYSSAHGEVDFAAINNYDRTYPIIVKTKDGTFCFTKQGKLYDIEQSECLLFPSKDQRDWSKFKPKKPKFDPKFKVGDMIRHKETNKDDVYEISKVYDDSYGIVGFTWMIYMKYQDQYELVSNKFDPKTLQPFDRVLVRDSGQHWCCDLFSNIVEATYHYLCVGSAFEYCIPYNDDTKHLVGTAEEAPEYYRYWED